MQDLLDFAQVGTLVAAGGWLIYAVLRTRAEFKGAAARCRVGLPESRSPAEQPAQKAHGDSGEAEA